MSALRANQEQKAIAKAFQIMKSSPEYLAESKEIDNSLNSSLPVEDEDSWWIK